MASNKHALANTFPVHGLTGKATNNNANKKARLDTPLRDFFEKLHDEAEVPATCLVREITGIGLRAGEEERTVLPTHMTKRGLYKTFCWEQGWKVTDARGKYTSTPRPPDAAFPEGTEPKDIMAWQTFLKYWNEKYPNLKIRASSEDICSECHIVAIRYKYKSFRELTSDASVTFSPENAELLKATRANTLDDDDDDDADDADDVELLKVALEHVVAAKDLHRQKNGVAAAIHEPALPRKEKVHSLTADYCMNASEPNPGADQPGETYYLSPLIVPIFRIACPSANEANDHLHAYVYYEHEAKKGGNNVCSLMWKYLKDRGLLNKDDPIGELNWTFDNCPGQNKKRMVIRFFMYLVERGFFLRVNLIFLVKGHTKNICDRAFNLLKLEYHNKNIYSTVELMEVLNTHDKVDESNFHDWDALFDELYGRPSGFTEKPHNFSFCHDTPGSVSYSMYDGQEVTTKNLRKVALDRDEILCLTPTLLIAPGMKDIKRMELWSKWRPLIPFERRKDFWFLVDPGPEMKQKVLRERADRLAMRQNALTSAVPVGPT